MNYEKHVDRTIECDSFMDLMIAFIYKTNAKLYIMSALSVLSPLTEI